MVETRSTPTPLIVRLLIEKGDLSMAQIQAHGVPMEEWAAPVEDYLVRNGLADEVVVASRTAEYLGHSWLQIAEDDPRTLVECKPQGGVRGLGEVFQLMESTRSVAERIPDGMLSAHQVVPVFLADESLHVLCLDPMDFSAMEELRMLSGMEVVPRVGTRSLYRQLAQLWEAGSTGRIKLVEDDDPVGVVEDSAVDVDFQRSVPGGRDTQVLRVVNTLLLRGLEEGASDIHLEPYENAVRLRYRVDGKLVEGKAPPIALQQQVISRLKILAKMDIAERRVPQDGAIAVRDGRTRIDLRVSTVPTVYGEKIVLRVLEKNAIPDDLRELGLSDKQAEDFADATQSHHGLVFVTGPTGSGKSTTLYCALEGINNTERNIATVEDPVEYKLFGLNQVQVSPAAGLTFASALRAFLRQDPDVMMVGEVRDEETARICMRAALTGHLVMSTLHTNSALQVVGRLIDIGIEPFLLGPALRLLQAQRLVRRLCMECRETYELPEEVAARFNLLEHPEIHKAGSNPTCLHCRGTGYRGRIGIFEVIRVSEEMQEMVAQRATHLDLRRKVLADGIDLLPQSARRAVVAGTTSLEEVADYLQST